MPWKRGELLKKDKGQRMCPLRYEGEPVPWVDIAEWISDEEGHPVHWQTIRNTFVEVTLKDLRLKLEKCPEIRDWMEDHGIPPTPTGDQSPVGLSKERNSHGREAQPIQT